MHARLFAFASALVVLPTLVAASFTGCDNNVIVPPGSTGGGGSGGGNSSTGTKPTTSSGKDGGKDAFPDYTEPGCPNPPPPVEDFQCDPYHQGNGQCGPDEGCYIYVQYPSEPCGQETYGAFCQLAGPGQQGDGCQGAQACGAGLACVITGSGTQCVQLCPLTGSSGCPSGFVCEPIDVEGFGGCL